MRHTSTPAMPAFTGRWAPEASCSCCSFGCLPPWLQVRLLQTPLFQNYRLSHHVVSLHTPVAGLVGAVVFWVLRHAIMSHDDPMGMAAFIVPLCAGVSSMLMVLSMSGTVPGYKDLGALWKAVIGMGVALVAVIAMGCANRLLVMVVMHMCAM